MARFVSKDEQNSVINTMSGSERQAYEAAKNSGDFAAGAKIYANAYNRQQSGGSQQQSGAGGGQKTAIGNAFDNFQMLGGDISPENVQKQADAQTKPAKSFSEQIDKGSNVTDNILFNQWREQFSKQPSARDEQAEGKQLQQEYRAAVKAYEEANRQAASPNMPMLTGADLLYDTANRGKNQQDSAQNAAIEARKAVDAAKAKLDAWNEQHGAEKAVDLTTFSGKVEDFFYAPGVWDNAGLTAEQAARQAELKYRLETGNLSRAEKDNILQELHEMDSNAGREARAYTGGERARNFFDSWVQGFRGSYANAAGNIAELNKDSGTGADAVRQSIEQEISAMERQRQQAEKELENAQWLAKLGDTEAVKNATEKLSGIDNYINYLKNELGKAGQKIAEQTDEQILKPLYNYADRELSASGEKMNAAKYGTSRAGQFALDIGKTGLDMAADAALNIPMQGAGLASMAARVYGQTAAEARNEGDSAEKAAAKGLTSALIEIATEKLGGTNLSYGEGAFSKAIKNAGDKLAGSTAWRIVSDTLGEGFEEVLSDVLNTVAEHGFGWDDGTRTLGEALKDESGQMLYDFLLGSAVGALGTGANAVTGAYKRGGGAPTQETNAVNNAAPAVPATVDVSNLENTTVPAQNAAEAPQAAEALQATIEEQNNTASTQETGSIKDTPNEIVAKLKNNIPYLHQEPIVSTLNGNEFARGEKKLSEQVSDFFKSFGNKVFRSGLGNVVLDERGVKSDIAHGLGRAKSITFAAVPDVIASGKQIDFQENWKGRGYDSYVFAAPIKIGEKTSYVAAVVLSDTNNRFYLHEVVDENGNLIYSMKKASSTSRPGLPQTNGGVTGVKEASPATLNVPTVLDDISSNTSIPIGGENVNGNFTTAQGTAARTSPVDTLLSAAGINTQPAPQNVSEAQNQPAEMNVQQNEQPQAAEAPQAENEQNKTASTQETENRMMSDADLQDYLSVGERKHVRNAKEAQLNSGDSPILTTIGQIRNFIRTALYGEQTDTIKAYGKVGGKMARDISTASDGKTNVSGYYLELDGNRIRHMKDHVDTDTDGRNVPLTSTQAEQLTDYIDQYDSVLDVLTRKDGSTKVYLSKDTGDGHVVIVELVSKGRQSLQPVTAWQNTYEAFENIWGKKRADSASQAEENSGSRGYQPALTETPSSIVGNVSAEAPASNTSIPTTGENVNGNVDTTARTSPVDTLLGAAGINTQPALQNVSEAGNSSIQTAQSGENVNVDYTAAANEAFNAATAQQERLDNIAGEISAALGVPYYPGKQKSVSSIISRLSRNEARGKGNDWHTLKDLARTHIEMNSWEDIPKVLSMLDEMKIPYTASAKSTDFGYKGFHIVWYENGVGHELQLSTPEAWAVKQKSEEIYAKWRDATAEPDFVPTAEFDKDVAESIAMFNQLNLPDFSSFATSSGVSNRASSSKSSPNNIGERSEPQPPSANSENGLPGSYLITRPESVNVTPIDNPSNSNNQISSIDIIQNLPQTVNGNFTTAEGGERYRSNLGAGKGKTRRSQTVETIAEAKITADAPPMFAAERREQLNSYVRNGRFDYIPDTNEAQTKRAKRAISEKGWSQAVQDFHDAVNSGKASKDLVAQGAVLLNNATNSGASGGEYLDLASDYIELLHRAGEILQAGKILQQLTPEGRLYCMQKTVKRINNSLTKGQHKAIAKAREGKNYKNIREAADDYGVTLDESLATAYLDAKTDEQRDAVLSQIQQNIADQIPSTFADKWNAMRYVNMLGNFKTQARNLIGNSAMLVTQTAKNRVKAAAEVTANLFRAEDNKMERTAVFWVNGELLKQAAADFDNIRDIARGEGKYNDTRKFAKEIEDKRTILKVSGEWGKTADSSFAKAGLRKAADVGMSVLDGYRKLTNWAMDAGDVIFLKATYADALGGWMKAHGIKSIADATPEQLERGRAYAIKEAQEATFRDDNAVSKAVTSIGRNPITEGIIPFRKTPANVAVRALEYSPVGVAETIYKGIQTKKGDATANDVINSLSKNIMGSLLSAAGYVLAKAGFARGNEDDEELDNFQKMQGKQDYAVKIGNEWVSLSQLAPGSVPLFMGVKLYELLDGGSLSLDDATKILGCLNDPLMDMSMLSGVNDALSDAVSYGNDADMFWKVLANAMLSYLTQGINNSLIGQIEQATEKNRQTIYTDKNSPLPSNVQRKIGQAAAKIPGVDYHQQDYVDAWGRTQSNGGRGKRIFDAIINPFYSSTDSTSEVDAELERIHKAGTNVDGFPEVLPGKAKRSMEYIKGMTMTPEEYKQYSIDRGTKSLELVTDFMQSKEYKSLTDQQRAEVISDLYGLAANQAINKVKATNGVDYSEIEKLKGISDEDAPEYLAVKQVLSDAKNGKTKAWDSVDMLLAGIKDYSPEVQKKLQSDRGLHVNKLLYADDKGIDTEEWFKAYDAIGENIEANGGSDADWVIAEAIGKLGGSDADKLNTLQSFNTPEKEKNGDGYKRNGAVRRYDAAINSGFSYDEWTEVEKAISAAGGWSAAEKAKTPALEAAGFTAQEIKDIYAVHNASNKDSKVNYLDEYWQGLIDGTALKNSEPDSESVMRAWGLTS